MEESPLQGNHLQEMERVNVISRVDAIGASLRNGESESCHERVLARFLLDSNPAVALTPRTLEDLVLTNYSFNKDEDGAIGGVLLK